MSDLNCAFCNGEKDHLPDCVALKLAALKSDPVKPDHYKGNGMAVWDVWDAFDCGRYESNIIKYVLRHKSKNGVEDLKKARTYLDRLIEQAEELK